MFNPNDSSAKRVLVVDDNDDAAQLLAMFIGAFGHAGRVANDGPSGLAMAAEFMPEIVFLDLGMPGMSGYDVALRLRTLPGLEHIYITALTGWNDASTGRKVAACGFDRHLTKPANIADIQSILDKGGRTR